MSQQKVTLKTTPSLSFWLFGLIALAMAIGAILLTFARMPMMAFRVVNPVMHPAAALPARPVEISGFTGYEYALRYGPQGKAPAVAAPANPAANSAFSGYENALRFGPESAAPASANTGRIEKFDPATNSILLPGNRVVHPAVGSKTVDLGAGYTLKTGPLGGVIIAPEAAPVSAQGKRMDIGGGYWLEYNMNGDAGITAPSSPIAPKPADAAKVKRLDVGGGYWLETNLTTGETWLAAPQTVVIAAEPKRTYIGAGFWLVTDPATGATTITAP